MQTQKSIAGLDPRLRLDDNVLEGGRTVPSYSMHSYINTPEGWTLYGECLKSGNMEQYRQARREWEEANPPQPMPLPEDGVYTPLP